MATLDCRITLELSALEAAAVKHALGQQAGEDYPTTGMANAGNHVFQCLVKHFEPRDEDG